MINISVSEDGSVQYGDLFSKPDCVRFFTKHRYPQFYRRPGSNLILSFLKEVLDESQLKEAHEYAKSQEDQKLYFKYFYRKAGEFLGCTPKRALKLWNAAEFYTKLQPRLDLVNTLARGRGGRVLEPAFRALVRNENLLKEVYDDGLKNILPLVFFFKNPPQVLKKGLGKALWKRLANNSFHRNALIARVLHRELTEPSSENQDLIFEIYRDFLLRLEKIPSTLLANRDYMEFYLRYSEEQSSLDFVQDKIMRIIPMKQVGRFVVGLMRRKIDLIIDTCNMAEQLGEKFDIWKYNIDNFEEEHDRFTKMIQEKRYSPESLKVLEEIDVKYFKVGPYEIELLDSRYKIHEEGKEMHHCVGSYAERVAKGTDLIYSIRKDGKRVSTLGLRKSQKTFRRVSPVVMSSVMIENRELAMNLEIMQIPMWEFVQHHGFANRRLENRMQVFMADLVLSRLNGDSYVSDRDLFELEYHLGMAESEYENMQSILQYPVDRLKFNPYSPQSYKSVYDYRYQQVSQDPFADPRALMA